MNNTLNLNRLGKTIKHDGMNYIPNMGWTLIILFAIPLVLWLLRVSTFSEAIPENGYLRLQLIQFLKYMAIIIAPVKLYKNCNDPRKGIGYAMLPASSLEKFISMVFYCIIVTPIIYMVGALAIDTILTIIPINNPYNGFAINDIFNTFPAFEGQLGNITNNEAATYIKTLSPAIFTLQSILNIVAIASIFMFGNMVFKKRKTQKMIGILLLLLIIFTIILINIIMRYEAFFENFTEEDMVALIVKIINFVVYGSLVFSTIVSAVMLWGTYHKIKTQKY